MKKIDKGSLILEFLLMTAVLAIIFPLMMKQSKVQIEKGENIIISKELMRMKVGIQSFFKTNPTPVLEILDYTNTTKYATIGDTDFCFIDLSLDLPALKSSAPLCKDIMITPPDGSAAVANSLETDLQEFLPELATAPNNRSTSVGLGYYIMIKITRLVEPADGRKFQIEGFIFAEPENIIDLPDIRKLEILKEVGSEGGYAFENASTNEIQFQGYNWFETSASNLITPGALLIKTNEVEEVGQYVSRKKNITNTMQTNIIMNENPINNINNLSFSGADSSLEIPTNMTTSGITNLNMNIRNNMIVKKLNTNILLPYNINVDANKLTISNSSTVTPDFVINKNLYFSKSLTANKIIGQNLFANTMIITNSLINTGLMNLVVRGEVQGKTTDLDFTTLKLDADLVYADTTEISAGNSLKYSSSENPSTLFFLANDLNHSMKNLIVKNLNQTLLGRNFGGIIVSNRTSLEQIITALDEEIRDVFKTMADDVISANADVCNGSAGSTVATPFDPDGSLTTTTPNLKNFCCTSYLLGLTSCGEL